MSDNVCVCRFCADWRENGFSEQHGLATYTQDLFMPRPKGALVPLESDTISNTCVMLRKAGKKPLTILQGHRYCAAVNVGFSTNSKNPADLDSTDGEFIRSYSDPLRAVRKYAASLDEATQLRILEKACVIQGINNLFSFKQLAEQADYKHVAYGYYSLTWGKDEPTPTHGSQIDLMIYDPQQGVFTRAAHGNDGIRVSDLVDLKTLTSKTEDRFRITGPVDLDIVVRNEARFATAQIVPRLDVADMGSLGREQIRHPQSIEAPR